MNIDFHYGVVYIISRTAGLDKDAATIVAHACQYVDDSTVPGILRFSTGETFERFASAHTMYDFHNRDDGLNRLVWVPFHFLPGNEGSTLEERAICRPDSEIAREMVRYAIRARQEQRDNILHRLGVALHVYVDTWAHQGFSGIDSPYNRVKGISVENVAVSGWLETLKNLTDGLIGAAETDVLSRFFPLGHGAALHYPDLPWIKWSYVNGYDHPVERDNLSEFLVAADMACRAVRGFLSNDVEYEKLDGLSSEVSEVLHNMLATNQSEDSEQRMEVVRKTVAQGTIPSIPAGELIPEYVAKGVNSWKALATGITSLKDDGTAAPVYGPAFEDSDYRKFHDAVKEHRFQVTQQILPAKQLRLA